MFVRSSFDHRGHRETSTLDLFDRVLDKGIVIEYRAHVSVGGIDTLITIDARYVVTSIHTCLEYGDRVLELPPGTLTSKLPDGK